MGYERPTSYRQITSLSYERTSFALARGTRGERGEGGGGVAYRLIGSFMEFLGIAYCFGQCVLRFHVASSPAYLARFHSRSCLDIWHTLCPDHMLERL